MLFVIRGRLIAVMFCEKCLEGKVRYSAGTLYPGIFSTTGSVGVAGEAARVDSLVGTSSVLGTVDLPSGSASEMGAASGFSWEAAGLGSDL